LQNLLPDYTSNDGKVLGLTAGEPAWVEQAIDSTTALLARPDLWTVGVEYDFGNNLYGIRAADITFSPNGTSGQQITLATGLGASKVLTYGGSITQSTDSNSSWMIPYATAFKIGFKITTAGVLTMVVASDGTQSNWKTDNIWVTYKKPI
jgi:hypothetical protein